jgi:outer membrane protein insertion porin family
VLGGAETLEMNASVGTKTRSAYQATLATPVFASPYLNFSVSGFSLDRDNTAFASHRELAQGGRLKLSAISPWGLHDLSYEYVQRDIGHLTPRASAS